MRWVHNKLKKKTFAVTWCESPNLISPHVKEFWIPETGILSFGVRKTALGILNSESKFH